MIKVIKINELVFERIEPYTINENGERVWNIPSSLEELRKCTIDTFNWLIGQKVKEVSGGDSTKLSAANSKAIVLLVKLVDTLKPDTSKLTDKEKQIFNLLKEFANNGYSDSELLLNPLNAVLNNIGEYSQKITKAQNAKSVDELIKLLSE